LVREVAGANPDVDVWLGVGVGVLGVALVGVVLVGVVFV
jgi:hypothetical protein